jgi:tRNA A-37 threonylcarbamoyl transferase component Bud32
LRGFCTGGDGEFNSQKVSEGEIKGWVKGEVWNDLPAHFFEDAVSSIQGRGGEVLKESKWRWAALIRVSNGRRFFFKRDKTKGRGEGLKYLFSPSKGQKEFLIASQLEQRGLPIPRPLGWMERVRRGWVKESYYLSEAIGTGVSFIEEGAKSKEPHSIHELAKTVRKFQEAGLFHRDLHGGNFLWEDDKLFLIDLHRAKLVKSLSLRRKLWDLSHLFHSLRSWGEDEQLRFLDQYFEGKVDGSHEREMLHQKIHPIMNRLQRRQWRSRTKRCLKESTEFTVQQEKGSVISSERFPSGSFEKGDGRTPGPGERKAYVPDQVFSGGHRFHIE